MSYLSPPDPLSPGTSGERGKPASFSSFSAFSAFLLVCLALLAAAPAAGQGGSAASAAEGAFAAFRARDLQGREVSASSLRGRVVVLDFWATWCAPCLAELPTLQRLRRSYPQAEVEIVGISLDVLDRRGLVAWLNRQDVTWTQVHDRRAYNGDLARQFRVHALPTSYVFDAEGRLAATNVRGERLLQTVAALTRRPAPAP